MIVSLSAAGTVILVTRAAPTAERYLFGSDLARGDGYSFRKTNRLPPNADIVATIQYGNGEAALETEDIRLAPPGPEVTDTLVKELYDKISITLAKLAKG